MTYLLCDKGNNIYKIGTTRMSVDKRITAFCKHPGISIVADTKKNIEKELHKKFESKRIGTSEWFHLNEKDVELILSAFEVQISGNDFLKYVRLLNNNCESLKETCVDIYSILWNILSILTKRDDILRDSLSDSIINLPDGIGEDDFIKANTLMNGIEESIICNLTEDFKGYVPWLQIQKEDDNLSIFKIHYLSSTLGIDGIKKEFNGVPFFNKDLLLNILKEEL